MSTSHLQEKANTQNENRPVGASGRAGVCRDRQEAKRVCVCGCGCIIKLASSTPRHEVVCTPCREGFHFERDVGA